MKHSILLEGRTGLFVCCRHEKCDRFSPEAIFIFVDSDVKKMHVSFTWQKKISYLQPQYLEVVVIECAVKGMLPNGLI